MRRIRTILAALMSVLLMAVSAAGARNNDLQQELMWRDLENRNSLNDLTQQMRQRDLEMRSSLNDLTQQTRWRNMEMRNSLNDLRQQIRQRNLEMRSSLNDLTQQTRFQNMEMRNSLNDMTRQVQQRNMEMRTSLNDFTQQMKLRDMQSRWMRDYSQINSIRNTQTIQRPEFGSLSINNPLTNRMNIEPRTDYRAMGYTPTLTNNSLTNLDNTIGSFHGRLINRYTGDTVSGYVDNLRNTGQPKIVTEVRDWHNILTKRNDPMAGVDALTKLGSYALPGPTTTLLNATVRTYWDYTFDVLNQTDTLMNNYQFENRLQMGDVSGALAGYKGSSINNPMRFTTYSVDAPYTERMSIDSQNPLGSIQAQGTFRRWDENVRIPSFVDNVKNFFKHGTSANDIGTRHTTFDASFNTRYNNGYNSHQSYGTVRVEKIHTFPSHTGGVGYDPSTDTERITTYRQTYTQYSVGGDFTHQISQTRPNWTQPSEIQTYQPLSIRTYEPLNIQTYQPPSIQAYEPLRIQTYEPPRIQAYEPLRIQTYEPPRIQTYEPLRMQTYEPPRIQTYQPPRIQTYEPPKIQRYQPPPRIYRDPLNRW